MKYVALVALLFGATVVAQVPGYPTGCASCRVYGWVDTPSQGAAPAVSQSGWTVEGWGFNCESGQPVDRVDVWYRGDDGYFHSAGAASILGYFERWDVMAAYAPACPHVSSVTGIAAAAPLMPLGTRDVLINLWRGPYYEQHLRRVTIVP